MKVFSIESVCKKVFAMDQGTWYMTNFRDCSYDKVYRFTAEDGEMVFLDDDEEPWSKWYDGIFPDLENLDPSSKKAANGTWEYIWRR